MNNFIQNNIDNVNEEFIHKFISSFKKNSWISKSMFASNIEEITIKRDEYNFIININIPQHNNINIPFYYKPNKRKRKNSSTKKVEDNYNDEGYETNSGIDNKSMSIVDIKENFIINSNNIITDIEKKLDLEISKIDKNINKDEIPKNVQKKDYENIVGDLNIKPININNKNKSINDKYIKFGDLNFKIEPIDELNKINYKFKNKRKNVFNEINDLSSYVAEYLYLINKILSIYFNNKTIISIISTCLEKISKIQFLSFNFLNP